MSSQVQIIGGAFQSPTGVVLNGGTLTFVLSQDAQVTVGETTEQVCGGETITVPLDVDGNIVTSPEQTIWPNDVLSPDNTFYTVSAYSAEGQLVWGPNCQQVLSTPSPFNVGAWVPGSINIIGTPGGGSVASVFGRTGNVTAQESDYSAFYEPLGEGGDVSSVFGRTGAVTAASGDYTVSQVTGAAPIASPTFTGTVTAPTFVGSLTGNATSATTAANATALNGLSVPVSAIVTGTNSSSQLIPVVSLPSTFISGLGTAAIQNTTGGGAAVTTGPTSSTSGDIAKFGASGVLVDSGVLLSSIPTLGGNNVWTGGGSNLFDGVVTATSTITVNGNSATSPTNFLGVQAPNPASSGSNVAPPPIQWSSAVWNGTASIQDLWKITSVIGTGSEPTSTLEFTHSGSTGTASVTFPGSVVIPSATINGGTILNTVIGSATINQNTGGFSEIIVGNQLTESYLFSNPSTLEGINAAGSGVWSISNTTGSASFAGGDAAISSTGIVLAAGFTSTQVPTASSTASNFSIPITVNNATYYMRLSTTP